MDAIEGRLRRYYRFTDDGATALAADVARIRQNAKVAEARLRGRGTGAPALGAAR